MDLGTVLANMQDDQNSSQSANRTDRNDQFQLICVDHAAPLYPLLYQSNLLHENV